jgi:assimilatory nitrate reductase catalytic subunit
VAKACDVPAADIKRLYDLFAAYPRTVTLFSQGINQSVRGTDQVNAIINLHLATGRMGKPGAGPFSITGQPNAMGGREVGGLSTMLAAHMDFAPENVARVQRFWAAPNMASRPGLKAVDMFRELGEGRIKAIWIMATNPAASMPDAARVRDALKGCPFVVVSDVVADTDTSRFAHVRLPASAWGEKEGTVTNSERCISRQRALLPAPGEARPDWWIISEVARRMGWESAFAYDRPADIWREHARLSAYQNDGKRLFDLRAQVAIGNAAYDAMAPFRWGGMPFADGRFPTPDGRARMVAVRQARLAPPLADWPLTLNTGRYRDQWHTMTRTGQSPRLARHRQEPLVEVHPQDATKLGITDGDLARISTPQGASIFRASVTDLQRPGEIFAPIHWTDRQSSGGRIAVLTRPLTDPHSGQPGFKMTPAQLAKVAVDWSGFLIAKQAPEAIDALYATRVRVPQGWLVEIAGTGSTDGLVRKLLPAGELVEAQDVRRGQSRFAVVSAGRLEAALYLSRTGALPSREWLIARLDAADCASAVELLAGRPAVAPPDRGAIVCACFDIGARTLARAMTEQRLTSVEEVGAALRAGTNCGSCRPAIGTLLRQQRERAIG